MTPGIQLENPVKRSKKVGSEFAFPGVMCLDVLVTWENHLNLSSFDSTTTSNLTKQNCHMQMPNSLDAFLTHSTEPTTTWTKDLQAFPLSCSELCLQCQTKTHQTYPMPRHPVLLPQPPIVLKPWCSTESGALALFHTANM